MKLIKFFILTLTILSITLISACGSNPISNTDYTGNWYAIDSKERISKLIIQTQGENLLVTHKDYYFDPDCNLDTDAEHQYIGFNTKEIKFQENKLMAIKNNVLEFTEQNNQGTLIYKNGKLIGKPNQSYEETLTFEKDTQNNPKEIYNKAKKQLENYMSTKKHPQDPKTFHYYDNEKAVKGLMQ